MKHRTIQPVDPAAGPALRRRRWSDVPGRLRRATLVVLVAGLALGALGPPAPLSAEPVKMTLDEATDRALAQNLDLLLQRQSQDSARRRADQAWSELLPSVNASAGVSRSRSLLSDSGSGSTTQVTGSLSMGLALRPGLAATIRDTRLELEAETITTTAARTGLINAVEREFLYLVANAGTVDLEELALELARSRLESVQTRYRQGRASELDVLEAQVAVAQQEPVVQAARADYESGLREFAGLLGMDPATDLELDGEVTVEEIRPDADRLVGEFLATRSDVIAARVELESARNSRRETAGNGRFPTISVSAGWSGNVADPSGDWSDAAQDSVSLGLSVSIPVDSWIPASSTGQAIASATDQVTAARLRLDQTLQTAEREIRDAAAQVTAAWVQVASADASVERAQRAYEMTEEAYAQGSRSLLDVQDAQQSYLSARQSVLATAYQYRAALIDLRAALSLDSLEPLTNEGVNS